MKEKCFKLEMKYDQDETNFDVDASHAIKNQEFYTSFSVFIFSYIFLTDKICCLLTLNEMICYLAAHFV